MLGEGLKETKLRWYICLYWLFINAASWLPLDRENLYFIAAVATYWPPWDKENHCSLFIAATNSWLPLDKGNLCSLNIAAAATP